MPAGRPRTVSLSPDEMIALGEEMVAWVIKNDPIHLSMWYCIEKGYTDAEWDTMHVAPEFFPYYEKALKLVGYNYLHENSDVESSLKQRWQRVYFKDLRRQEDADKDADAARAKEIQPTIDPKTGELVEALLRQIAELQKKQSDQKAS
jgi:hypothetical protein